MKVYMTKYEDSNLPVKLEQEYDHAKDEEADDDGWWGVKVILPRPHFQRLAERSAMDRQTFFFGSYTCNAPNNSDIWV